ncbi:hypothetical protein NI456_11190 [Brevundimonas diminuta]|uniref:ABC-three component system middle component 6 n=1 Tax=Brevundimonas diminuta TaxID=293 RepID=UPI002097CFDB|nr:ABC-three component system middle component 6 [Brevundimonas diminuta]MCO8019421.1 hypothetical protein [Brevundimonas diminuta]MCO8022099.1 hypothetical protein [Brevundimonas diminuta]
MILPGKHLKPDRALLSVGGEILSVMGDSGTVSEVWDRVRDLRGRRVEVSPLPFDWFVLALTLLYAIGAIEQDEDHLIRRAPR